MFELPHDQTKAQNMSVLCPICNALAEEVSEEIDIGVGVQKFVTGWECPQCGPIAIRNCCGTVELAGHPHATWCQAVKEIID